MFYIYLLRSESYEDQRYTGFTNNLKQRLRKHNEGASTHTAKYRPWRLVAYFAFEDERRAHEFGFYLKTGFGKAFANKHLVIEPPRYQNGAAMPRKSYIPGDFELVVRRSKTGLGLFAEGEIPKGACIIEYTGVELSKEQEQTSRSKYLFEIHTRKTIDGSPRWNTARYINHSCRPNCEPNIHKGRVFIHARRRIRPGEELNYDYGKNYFREFLKDICACPKCEDKRAGEAKAKAAATKRRTAAAAARSRSPTKRAPLKRP